MNVLFLIASIIDYLTQISRRTVAFCFANIIFPSSLFHHHVLSTLTDPMLNQRWWLMYSMLRHAKKQSRRPYPGSHYRGRFTSAQRCKTEECIVEEFVGISNLGSILYYPHLDGSCLLWYYSHPFPCLILERQADPLVFCEMSDFFPWLSEIEWLWSFPIIPSMKVLNSMRQSTDAELLFPAPNRGFMSISHRRGALIGSRFSLPRSPTRSTIIWRLCPCTSDHRTCYTKVGTYIRPRKARIQEDWFDFRFSSISILVICCPGITINPR